MKKINIIITILFLNICTNSGYVYSKNTNELYEKIDLFSEVLETIKQDLMVCKPIQKVSSVVLELK